MLPRSRNERRTSERASTAPPPDGRRRKTDAMATRPAQDCRIRLTMADIELTVNGERRRTSVDPATPLLWVLRDEFGLTGTKFGCGIAQCGVCTVRLEGDAVRSCVTPVSRAAGKRVTTIEGLSGDQLHAVQQAWLDEQVPQCGYFQPG